MMFSLFKKPTPPVVTQPTAPPVASPDLQAQADACIETAYALEDANQWDDAIAQYRAALALVPGYWRALVNLGNALKAVGQLDAAHQHYQEAYAQNPNSHGTCYNLGADYIRLGLMAEAVPLLQRAIELKPDFADAMVLLAEALETTGQALDGVQWLARAIKYQPDNYPLQGQLLLAQEKMGLIRDGAQTAIEIMRRFAPEGRIDPVFLADYYRRNDEIFDELRAYQDIPPQEMTAPIYSNYLYALNFVYGGDAVKKLAEHRKFHDLFGSSQVLPDIPVSGKAIKCIGFISPDFRNHPVFDFLIGLLLHLDRKRYKVQAYSLGAVRDSCTERVKQAVDTWRDLNGLEDRVAAEVIRADGVDILIDLAGHTGNNAMPILCYRPAPLQVTWLGYPTTTGIPEIDFRIVDSYTDPPGLTEAHHSETLIRLPNAQWCYTPWRNFLSVSELPALSRGYVTLATLGVRRKVNEPMIQRWAELMAALPGSRMMLANIRLGDDRQWVTALFAAQGVDASRLEFVMRSPSYLDYVERYRQVDMVLDTHPYTGCTTICDALYMGVPALTIAGKESVARCAASILNQVGLSDFVVDDPDQYVTTGLRLLSDLPSLARVRAGLRERFMTSPLTDQFRFAQDFADALDAMWANRLASSNRTLI